MSDWRALAAARQGVGLSLSLVQREHQLHPSTFAERLGLSGVADAGDVDIADAAVEDEIGPVLVGATVQLLQVRGNGHDPQLVAQRSEGRTQPQRLGSLDRGDRAGEVVVDERLLDELLEAPHVDRVVGCIEAVAAVDGLDRSGLAELGPQPIDGNAYRAGTGRRVPRPQPILDRRRAHHPAPGDQQHRQQPLLLRGEWAVDPGRRNAVTPPLSPHRRIAPQRTAHCSCCNRM